MEALLLVPFALVVFAFVATNKQTSQEIGRKLLKEFELVAVDMGLSFEVDSERNEIVLHGEREGIEVEARIALGGGLRAGTVIARPRGLSPEIRLLVTNQSTLKDFAIGDSYFDSLLALEGPQADLYAALRPDTRRALVTVIGNDGFRLEEGRLELELTARDESWARRNLDVLLRAARHFVMEETRAARFLLNYREEEIPLIALRNAKFLLQEEPGSLEAGELTSLLLEDALRCYGIASERVEEKPSEGGEASLQIPTGNPWRYAASAGVIRRVSTLELDLGEPVATPDVPERVRSFGAQPEWPLVLSMLLLRRPDAALPVVEGFLKRELGTSPVLDDENLSELARALGTSESPLARQLLWQIVREESGGRVAAVQSLGRVGGFEDVEPLLELPTGIFSVDLRSSIDAAVAAIQSRLKGGDTGALTIADGGEGTGGLSVALGEGALSEPRDEPED